MLIRMKAKISIGKCCEAPSTLAQYIKMTSTLNPTIQRHHSNYSNPCPQPNSNNIFYKIAYNQSDSQITKSTVLRVVIIK